MNLQNQRGVRWLYRELPGLVRDGVLPESAAAGLRDHYGPLPEVDRGRLVSVVIGLVGTLLVGGGVVLLVAHNWDSMSQLARTATALATLVVAQAITAWAWWRHRHSVAWIEGASLGLGLAVVASLALVHQIYQVQIEPNHFMMLCTVAVLPLVFILRSRVAAMLCSMGTAGWVLDAPWSKVQSGELVIFFALAAAIGGFVTWLLRQRVDELRTALVGWVAVPCLILSFFRLAIDVDHTAVAAMLSALLAGLFAIGVGLDRRRAEPLALWRNPWLFGGALGTGILIFAVSFQDAWNGKFELQSLTGGAGIGLLVILGGLLVATATAAYRFWRHGDPHFSLVTATPLLVSLLTLTAAGHSDRWVGALAISVFGLATGLTICVTAIRRGQLGLTNAGLLLMVAVLGARFVDSEWTFLARGIGFVALGIAFLAANVWMLRHRTEVTS